MGKRKAAVAENPVAEDDGTHSPFPIAVHFSHLASVAEIDCIPTPRRSKRNKSTTDHGEYTMCCYIWSTCLNHVQSRRT